MDMSRAFYVLYQFVILTFRLFVLNLFNYFYYITSHCLVGS